MSVYREDVIRRQRGRPDRVLKGHPGYALAALTAGQVRSRNQTVFPAPLPEEESRAKLCGPKPKATRRWFARQAEWVVPPPGGQSLGPPVSPVRVAG